jgi:hypothetical protein
MANEKEIDSNYQCGSAGMSLGCVASVATGPFIEN